VAFDITFGPGHAASERWGWGWRYGTGTVDASGAVSARSSSGFAGSNYDGAGVGFVFDVTNEWHFFVMAELEGWAYAEAVGYWGYANAEPMFELWLRGMSPETDDLDHHYEVGIEMRAVAPIFGLVHLGTTRRTVSPTLSYSRFEGRRFGPFPPGRVFAGAGVKTYAGTTGIAVANARIESVIRAIRVVGVS
jgi:hypothetical protein